LACRLLDGALCGPRVGGGDEHRAGHYALVLADEFDEPSTLMKGLEMYFGTDLDRCSRASTRRFTFVTPAATTVAGDESTARRQFGPCVPGATSGWLRIERRRARHDQVWPWTRSRVRRRRASSGRNANGTSTGRAAALYVCRRREASWRIAAVIQHPPECHVSSRRLTRPLQVAPPPAYLPIGCPQRSTRAV